MKILFLVENLDNETAKNLINALKNTGNTIDVIPYFANKKNQCHISPIKSHIENKQKIPALIFSGHAYIPNDYDAALLWCWGTASLGRKYLRLFENHGVKVLNSSYDTEITDSKIQFANTLLQANIPTPKTLCFESNTCINDINLIQERLGQPPYVFKPDYGTQGFEVHFAFSEKDIKRYAKKLRKNRLHDTNFHDNGFIVQEFIGDPNNIISHYRVLVIGDTVLPRLIKISAQSPMTVSNIAANGRAELIPIHHELKKVALLAAKASKLNVAGVDIMVKAEGEKTDIVVLEVNDGPGTKTFDKKGINASKAIIDYFIDTVCAAPLPKKIAENLASEKSSASHVLI